MYGHFVKFRWWGSRFCHKLGFHFIMNSFYFDFLILIIFNKFVHYILEIVIWQLIFSLYIVAWALIILDERHLLDFFISNLLLCLLKIQVNYSSYRLIVLDFWVDYPNRPLKFWFFFVNLINQITLFNESTCPISSNLQRSEEYFV